MLRRTAVCAAVLIATSGCSVPSGETESDAKGVELLQDPMGLCLARFDADLDYTHGHEIVTNSGDRDAVITDVRLVEPRGVTLVDTVVLPLADRQQLVGSARGWPPLGSETSRWKRAVASRELKVQSDSRSNLIVRLRPEKGVTSATLKGIEIEYRVGSQEGHTSSRFEVELRDKCD